MVQVRRRQQQQQRSPDLESLLHPAPLGTLPCTPLLAPAGRRRALASRLAARQPLRRPRRQAAARRAALRGGRVRHGRADPGRARQAGARRAARGHAHALTLRGVRTCPRAGARRGAARRGEVERGRGATGWGLRVPGRWRGGGPPPHTQCEARERSESLILCTYFRSVFSVAFS